MDENRDLNLEPISSSFLVEHILRRSESKAFEGEMEDTHDKRDGSELQTTMDYETLTGSSTNDEFTGLSCMVAEAEIKGARQFVKGILLLNQISALFYFEVLSSVHLGSYCWPRIYGKELSCCPLEFLIARKEIVERHKSARLSTLLIACAYEITRMNRVSCKKVTVVKWRLCHTTRVTIQNV